MREQKSYFVYIMGSLSGTCTSASPAALRIACFQHKEHIFDGFTSRYDVDRLLYWESFDDVRTAIDREKQLKGWRRSKKIALIESLNPLWLDLSRGWYSQIKGGGASRDASTPSARSQATGQPTLSMTPRHEK